MPINFRAMAKLRNMAFVLSFILAGVSAVGSQEGSPVPKCPDGVRPIADWYPEKTYEVFDTFLNLKLGLYRDLKPGWVEKALKLGACTECDPSETRWNTHFKIVNGTAYSAGGIPTFWNDHHRKRVKSVFTLLTKLLFLEPNLPDVEFVVNFHDYNKLLREESLQWGDFQGASPSSSSEEIRKDELNGDAERDDRMGQEGAAGTFKEHMEQWPGQDWQLYYRIHGNHFGNPPLPVDPGVRSSLAPYCWTTC
jgi:hypothetical protein